MKSLTFLKAFIPCIFAASNLFAQTSIHGLDLSQSFPSPDVATLGRFGEYPVNYFIGQPGISIPLYNISYKDLSIPLSVDYSAGGLKPDDHPGQMGLGWMLKAGGVITRRTVGPYDERPRQVIAGLTYTYEIGYYDNCGKLNQSNWASPTFLSNHLFAQIPEFDSHPDEFIFNFNGYSGSFFITRPYDNGPVEIKVRPNGAYHLKAEINEMRDYLDFDDYINIHTAPLEFETRRSSRLIYKITITDDKGIKYIFGGTNNSIEFNNNGDLNISHPQANIPNAWYLTEIKSPFGYGIQLNYKRAGRVFVEHKQRSITAYSATSDLGASGAFIFYSQTMGSVAYSGGLENISIVVINAVYLESIVTPKQTVTFSTSPSTELNYPCISAPLPNVDNQKLREVTEADLSNHHGGDRSSWQKLTEINIAGLYKIKFDYIESATTRLRLNKIEYSINNVVDRSYSFIYNPMYLPDYLSRKADHWGYYNGRPYAYNGLDYLTLREPDEAFLEAEILTRIIYPTGGYTEFEYEPHDYSKVAQQFPFDPPLSNSGGDKIAGGLRVKKITSTANFNSPAVIKEFFYKTNYVSNGTSSSGILSGNVQYSNTGTGRNSYTTTSPWGTTWSSFSYYFGEMIDNNILPLSETNGSHVTYSEVTVKENGGYSVYKYTNHDNILARDESPVLFLTNFTSKWIEQGFISRQAYRGLLTDNIIYDITKSPVKETHYDYFIDTETSFFKVLWLYRYFHTYGNPQSGGFELGRALSLFTYTKPPLLKKETTTTYTATGGFITTSRELFYTKEIDPVNYVPQNDNFKEKLVRFTDSKGSIKEISYKQSIDIGSSTTTTEGLALGSLIDGNYWGESVYSVSKTGASTLEHTFTTYKNYNGIPLKDQDLSTEFRSPYTGAINTGISGGALQIDPQLKSQVKYVEYDNYGNVLQINKNNDYDNSLIWDYKKEFAVAKVIKAANSQVAYSSFEADGLGNWTYSGPPSDDVTAPTGKKAYILTGSNNIIKSGLTATNTYVVSYWIKNSSSPLVITGTQGLPVAGRTFGLWKYYEHKVSAQTQIVITGNNQIDELRLYPNGAQMTTYTYEPLIGMTSQCDANNRIIYYEYDSFNRLSLIRDQDQNIIKKFDYKYQATTQQ